MAFDAASDPRDSDRQTGEQKTRRMKLLSRLQARIGRSWRHARARASFRHIAGPRRFDLADDDAVVVLVVKDGAYHLPYFLDWHRGLGFNKFVIVDNLSRDTTLDIAKASPDTIVASCSADFSRLEPCIRYYANTLYTRGGWNLMVDVDELFEYPRAATVPLRMFLRNLNAQGATGVIAQMLDFFPRRFADLPPGIDFKAAVDRMDRFDLASIVHKEYDDPDIGFSYFMAQNTRASRRTNFMFGGIRAAVFGETCCLTKHPLFRHTADVIPGEHPHVSRPLHCADFTCLLRHYKFTGDYVARDLHRADHDRFDTDEYALRAARFRDRGVIEFHRETSVRYQGFDDLIARGFLVAPPPDSAPAPSSDTPYSTD